MRAAAHTISWRRIDPGPAAHRADRARRARRVVRRRDPRVGRGRRRPRLVQHRLRRRRLRPRPPDRVGASSDRRLHARHRPALPRDLRALAAPRAALRDHDSRRAARADRRASRPPASGRRSGNATPIGAAACGRWRRSSARSRAWTSGSPRFAATRRPNARPRPSSSATPATACSRSTRWCAGRSKDVWRFVHANDVPYNPLHDQGYPSIGCQPCTSAVAEGEDPRAGRWRGREKRECGLHVDPINL